MRPSPCAARRERKYNTLELSASSACSDAFTQMARPRSMHEPRMAADKCTVAPLARRRMRGPLTQRLVGRSLAVQTSSCQTGTHVHCFGLILSSMPTLAAQVSLTAAFVAAGMKYWANTAASASVQNAVHMLKLLVAGHVHGSPPDLRCPRGGQRDQQH